MEIYLTDSENIMVGRAPRSLGKVLASYIFYDKSEKKLVGRFLLPLPSHYITDLDRKKFKNVINIWLHVIANTKEEMIEYMDFIEKYYPVIISAKNYITEEKRYVDKILDKGFILSAALYVREDEESMGVMEKLPELIRLNVRLKTWYFDDTRYIFYLRRNNEIKN